MVGQFSDDPTSRLPYIRSEEHRLVLRFGTSEPVDVDDLSASLRAVAHFYERHRALDEIQQSTKLFVTNVKTGSYVFELGVFGLMLGQALPFAANAITVADFSKRLTDGVRAFAGWSSGPTLPAELPDRQDSADLRELLKPIAGKKAATLGIQHLKIKLKDGSREVEAEYNFKEAEINRAILNIERELETPSTEEMVALEGPQTSSILREVMLFFDQASRSAGKEAGRTSDRAIVPEVTDKPLPVHFRKSIADLKARMTRSDQNPLTTTYVVDVHVQYVNGEPKGYIVTELHDAVPEAVE